MDWQVPDLWRAAAFDAETGEGATIEHILPRSLGGANDLLNLGIAHQQCNGEGQTSGTLSAAIPPCQSAIIRCLIACTPNGYGAGANPSTQKSEWLMTPDNPAEQADLPGGDGPLPNRFTRGTLVGCLGICCVLALPVLFFLPLKPGAIRSGCSYWPRSWLFARLRLG